jgi:hypothetical protein
VTTGQGSDERLVSAVTKWDAARTRLEDAVSTAAGLLRAEITREGLYPDLGEAEYHADPAPAADGGSLSSTGARKITPPNTPAHYRWWREHGEPPKRAYDLGHAAHAMVLGRGWPVAVVTAENWKRQAAQDAAAAARAEGMVPLLTAEWQQVKDMAAELRRHPEASALLGEDCEVEQSMFWRSPLTGRWCRARVDAIRAGERRFADYKTSARRADRASFERQVNEHGYHQQGGWYEGGLRAVGWHEDPECLFVVHEVTPPYCVNVFQLDDEARRAGRGRNQVAEHWFDKCTTSGEWPGYQGIDLASLPAWAREEFM